jgi:hypothetical protein
MRNIIRCVGFLAFLAVSDAEAFETRATRLQAIKTVGVISALGDEMSVTRAGLVPLNTPGQSVSIRSWGLDELVVQQATTLLNGRFRVQPVSYPRDAFAAIRESAVGPVNLVRGDPFKAVIRSDVSPKGLDAYVVISRAKSKLGSGRNVQGIGFAEYRTLLASYGLIHTLYEVRVIDGKTFDVIEKRVASPLGNIETMRLQGPSQLVDGSFDGPAGIEALRAAIVDLITRSLPLTLGDMHLANTQQSQ